MGDRQGHRLPWHNAYQDKNKNRQINMQLEKTAAEVNALLQVYLYLGEIETREWYAIGKNISAIQKEFEPIMDRVKKLGPNPSSDKLREVDNTLVTVELLPLTVGNLLGASIKQAAIRLLQENDLVTE